MSWEKEPLISKAKLFFERAFDADRDESTFGLWCSLGLELLIRASLASISPTLLSSPDRSQKNLLYALNLKETSEPKSIPVTDAIELCYSLFPEFTDTDRKNCRALVNRRNEELHSGSAAFDEYKPSSWLIGFYQACISLSEILGESIEVLFNENEAQTAKEMLATNQADVIKKVKTAIQAHKRVFKEKTPKDQEKLHESAENEGLYLSTQQHHRVKCPACGSCATVQGHPFGKEHITTTDDEITIRQAISPTSFSCPACGLKLSGYAELKEANVSEHYTRTTTYSPEDYYGLIHPDDIESYLEDQAADYYEYDNE